MFAAVLKPGRSLMGRLTYLEKFLLILVLFVLPLATVMYAYITDANAQIDFANSELSGTHYLRPVNALFADVLRARGASLQSAAPDLSTVLKAIVTDLAAVAAVETQLGTSLKTPPSQVTASLRSLPGDNSWNGDGEAPLTTGSACSRRRRLDRPRRRVATSRLVRPG